MNQSITRARGLLGLVALLLAVACGQPREQALAPGSRVLALGDSLTAGNGVTPDEAWPALLAARSGWVVINGGLSGDTSAGALQRLPALLEEQTPALVLVTLGGNDMLRRLPQDQTIANLVRILELVKASGAKSVLLATPKPTVAGAAFHSLSAAEFYRQVAKEQKVALIEDAFANVLSDPQLKVDQLHPNVAGHALLSNEIFQELKAIGYAR